MRKYNGKRTVWLICLSLFLPLYLQACAGLKTEAPFSWEKARKLRKQVQQLLREKRYEEALPLAKQALEYEETELGSEHLSVAWRCFDLGKAYLGLGDYADAEPLFTRALKVFEKEKGPEDQSVAWTLRYLARIYKHLGDYDKAEPLLKRALKIREKELGPEHPKVANFLLRLTKAYKNLGDYAKAISCAERALKIFEKKKGPKHLMVGISLHALASNYRAMGDYPKIEPLFKRSIEIFEETLGEEDPWVARSLEGLAKFYRLLGDYAEAEPLFKRTLEIREEALGPEHEEVGANLVQLAYTYSILGDYAKAEPLFKRGIAIREEALGPEHPKVADHLDKLANFYRSVGNYTKAEAILIRALEIREKRLGPEHPRQARSLRALAKFYRTIGDYDKAEPLLKKGLKIMEKAMGQKSSKLKSGFNRLAFLYLEQERVAEALVIFRQQDSAGGLGMCYLVQKDYPKAKKEFLRALNEAERKGAKDPIILSHVGLGLSYEGLTDLDKAKEHFQAAIGIIEDQWKTLSLGARENFLAGEVGPGVTRLEPYEGMARILLKEKRTGYEAEALAYAEQVKSRIFLEMLAARGIKGRGTEDQQILARDRAFQQKIAAFRKQLSFLEELEEKAPPGKKAQVQKALDKAVAHYEQFIKEVKLENAEVAALINPESFSLEKIQALLDPDITLLEYYTAQDATYAFVVTRDSLKAHKIPLTEKRLAALVNDLLLPNISRVSRRPEPFIVVVADDQYSKETTDKERAKNRERFQQLIKNVYQKIVAPLEGDIHTKKLIIVPHGVLHKVPFAALSDGSRYMVDQYTLSVLPAAGVLPYVIKKRNPDNRQFIGFANPETDYVPLGFAEVEVNNIARLFAKKQVFFREKATEGTAKESVQTPDAIHFACHGEFNEKQPMQSGLLLAEDEDNDGYLQVHEIFGLDLKDANLVTLSACKTALSKIYSGDDLVGLSRGFIYAGTPSLIATLWSVDDHSTSILMKAFYENWQKNGLTKPEALRRAQASLKSMPQYRHPFYWAPFILIGDWR